MHAKASLGKGTARRAEIRSPLAPLRPTIKVHLLLSRSAFLLESCQRRSSPAHKLYKFVQYEKTSNVYSLTVLHCAHGAA